MRCEWISTRGRRRCQASRRCLRTRPVISVVLGSSARPLLVADVNYTEAADEIFKLGQGGGSTRDCGAVDVREGTTRAVASLPGARPSEGRDRPATRHQPAHPLLLDRGGATSPSA